MAILVNKIGFSKVFELYGKYWRYEKKKKKTWALFVTFLFPPPDLEEMPVTDIPRNNHD